MEERSFSSLLGETITAITADNDDVRITLANGRRFILHHHQDCCECVFVESVVGDLNDLLDSPLLVAEEVSNPEGLGRIEEYDSSFTWTFYRLQTIKGGVTIRFYGSSNGYYSEYVSFEELP